MVRETRKAAKGYHQSFSWVASLNESSKIQNQSFGVRAKDRESSTKGGAIDEILGAAPTYSLVADTL